MFTLYFPIKDAIVTTSTISHMYKRSLCHNRQLFVQFFIMENFQ